MYDAFSVRGKKLVLSSQVKLGPIPRACTCRKRSKHFIEDMNFETIKCQVSFFCGRLTLFLGLFAQVCQRWKFRLSLVFFTKSTNGESLGFYWYFWPSLPTVKVFIFIGRATIPSLFVRFVRIIKITALENFLVLLGNVLILGLFPHFILFSAIMSESDLKQQTI